ncbi:alpha/beta fold hydrolase [Halorussus halophilus]|uniref:alpha/beta fold hydrolase n=1 Tax=Halorussus halophilus TaxID=2650975 RepID=UPI0013016C82|nr:alpha/beta hydrolase [Halorussus halophilus]
MTTNALSVPDDAVDSADSEETAPQVVETSAGTTLCYATYGDPEGTPLVFFHGTPGSRLLGRLFDDMARENGVRVLAPDRPGYGRSALPSDYDLPDIEEGIAALAESVDAERVAVAGFSGGAPYALAAATSASERVRSVDLVSGAVPPAYEENLPTALRVMRRLATTTPSLLSAGFGFQAALARLLPPDAIVSQYTTESSPVEVSERVARLVEHDFREAFAETASGAVRDSQLFASSWNFDPETTSCPVRFWHGELDENVPVEGVRDFSASISHANLTVLDAHGHLETLLGARERVVRAVSQ